MLISKNNLSTENFLKTLPMGYSTWQLPSLSIVYLLVVVWIGPWYMKNRKPMRWISKTVVPLYNVIQVFVNGFIIYSALEDTEFIKFCFKNLDGNQDDIPIYIQNKFILLGYCWCLIKVSDFIDTVFFIMLKKYSHVSFLHVYHHATTMLVAFVVFRFIRTEQSLVYAAVNCVVHVVMYTYYLLTSLGQKPRWKHLVTTLQITQFFGLLIMTTVLITMQTKARYFYFSVFGIYQCMMYLYLFGKFYVKNYDIKVVSDLKPLEKSKAEKIE